VYVRPVDPQYPQGIGQHAGVHGVFDVADAQAAFFTTPQALAEGFSDPRNPASAQWSSANR
jgi:hypothetical protein